MLICHVEVCSLLLINGHCQKSKPVLLYFLCSGGDLFHVGHNGDLRSFSAYAADLHGWTKESADSIVRSNVDDPLAQDLLTKLVVILHTSHLSSLPKDFLLTR